MPRLVSHQLKTWIPPPQSDSYTHTYSAIHTHEQILRVANKHIRVVQFVVVIIAIALQRCGLLVLSGRVFSAPHRYIGVCPSSEVKRCRSRLRRFALP